MIQQKDCTNKSKSRYICDRCNREINNNNMYRIFRQRAGEKSPRRKWHFCDRCYRALVRGVEKKGGTNE